MQSKVNTFHVGPQKSGTTWLYRAFLEHAEVCVSAQHCVHFFDMYHYKGVNWYLEHFDNLDRKVVLDSTPSYIRDKLAPKRIYEHNPNANIIITARNPIERAFSHYWHEKKKDRFNFTFNEIFHNYDLFTNWVEPGMYALHLKRYLQYFPENQVKVLFFDDLKKAPEHFFNDVCTFCNIDTNIYPSIMHTKVNPAKPFKSYKKNSVEKNTKRISFMHRAVKIAHGLINANYKEELSDVDWATRNELLDVFYDDVCDLEQLTGRNLSHWKKGVTL